MTWLEGLSILLIFAGLFFFAAGSIGLLRFPDTLSCLHALTKSDNVGLGFVIVGSVLHSPTPLLATKLLFIWLLVLLSSATSCYLIAHYVQFEKFEDMEDNA
jgi:multicomponent Na+:H+ antiporter subunit G